MNKDKAFQLYMAAHVRMRSASSPPATWTPLEMAASYATLKPPEVEFPAWCDAFGLKLETVQTEEERANENAINLIVSDAGTIGAPPVSVEGKK